MVAASPNPLPLFGEEDSSKRRQILDGARKVFMDLGFDGASMNEIARSAGVSKGTLYVYFADKNRLFEAIWPLTLDTHAAALSIARDNNFSFYDALIVASAIEAGCDALYSEDMQHGRVIGGLTIRNPFIEGAP